MVLVFLFLFCFFFSQLVSKALLCNIKPYKNLNQLEGLIFLICGKGKKNEKPATTHFLICIYFTLLKGQKLKKKNLQSKTEEKYADPNTAKANKFNRVSSLQS